MTLRDRLRHARAARQRGQLISLRLDGVERLAGFLDDDVLAVDVDGRVQFFAAVDRRIDWTDSSPTIDFSTVRVRGEAESQGDRLDAEVVLQRGRRGLADDDDCAEQSDEQCRGGDGPQMDGVEPEHVFSSVGLGPVSS